MQVRPRSESAIGVHRCSSVFIGGFLARVLGLGLRLQVA